ncbi:MAG: Gfo/Idh/MocA family oxidoreductase [Chitinophagales bacterium]
MQPLRVGVVGYGIAAQVMHLPFLTTMEEYKLVSILERHNDLSKEKYPYAKIVRSIDEMVADPSLDLVVITTPNDTHFPFTEKALRAGKHVVLEKPFTITSEEGMALVELANASKGKLSVFQNRRYVSDFLTVKKIIRENMLGEIVEYEAHYDRYRPEQKPNAWREKNIPGSGILYDLGAHLIDQALCLFGLPNSITADIRMQRPHAKVDDYFDLRLDYGFTRVILKSGMLVREPGPRFMVHGRLGSFLKSGEDVQEAALKLGVLPVAPDWGSDPEDQWGLLHTEINGKIIKEKYPSMQGSFGLYYKNLYKSLALGEPLREKPEHGYNTIRIVELAMESSRKRATVDRYGLMNVDYP